MLLHTHQIQFTVSLLLSFVDADCRLAHSTYISTDAPIPLPPPPPKKKKHTFNCWLPSYLCWIYFAWSVPCLLVCLLVVYFVVYLVLNSLCLTHLYCKNFPVVCFRCGVVRFTYIQTQTSKKRHVSTCYHLDFHWHLGRCLQKPIVFIGYLREAAAAYARTKCYKTHN